MPLWQLAVVLFAWRPALAAGEDGYAAARGELQKQCAADAPAEGECPVPGLDAADCRLTGPECDAFRKILDRAKALAERVSSCGHACSAEQLTALSHEGYNLLEDYDGGPKHALLRGAGDYLARSLRAPLREENARLVAAGLVKLDKDVDGLDKEVSALERQHKGGAAAARVSQAGLWGGESLKEYRWLSSFLDDSDSAGPVASEDKIAAYQRERLNAHAGKLAQLRDRLAALRAKLGLPAAEANAAYGRSRLSPEVSVKLKSSIEESLAALRDPLPDDLSAAPRPAADSARRPFASMPPGDKNELDHAVLERVRSLHNHRLAATFGDPQSRGDLVHSQDDVTCAIVAQQQVLQSAGVVIKTANACGHPKSDERRLFEESKVKGYSADGEGTFDQYVGRILIDRGFLVKKHFHATDAQLSQAARTGNFLVAGVDAGLLWDNPDDVGGGHVILITGSEVDKSGKVLAYYVNDGMTDPPTRGKPVAAARLERAFSSPAGGRLLLEVR